MKEFIISGLIERTQGTHESNTREQEGYEVV